MQLRSPLNTVDLPPYQRATVSGGNDQVRRASISDNALTVANHEDYVRIRDADSCSDSTVGFTRNDDGATHLVMENPSNDLKSRVEVPLPGVQLPDDLYRDDALAGSSDGANNIFVTPLSEGGARIKVESVDFSGQNNDRGRLFTIDGTGTLTLLQDYGADSPEFAKP